MGSAASKGWTITGASNDNLLLMRPLNTDAVQAVVGEPISREAVEVATDFYKRLGGVTVVTSAAVIASKLMGSVVRIDYTNSYRDELNFSLGTLQRSWNRHRLRIAVGSGPFVK